MDLEALETSFDLFAPRGDKLVDVFYTRLFQSAPALRPLFADIDLEQQKSKLLDALLLLRESLRDLDSIAPQLRELGARHFEYGTRAEHYPVVGGALITSMAQIAGDAWCDECATAWAEAFGLVAQLMLEGAALAEEAAA